MRRNAIAHPPQTTPFGEQADSRPRLFCTMPGSERLGGAILLSDFCGGLPREGKPPSAAQHALARRRAAAKLYAKVIRPFRDAQRLVGTSPVVVATPVVVTGAVLVAMIGVAVVVAVDVAVTVDMGKAK
mmetsp:Transcript_57134/g.114518  ORF Transcript_57134/g.114518 Transcript_57134/m.114518 type:complete len:129 (-) Transcript_57134:450-836(-)